MTLLSATAAGACPLVITDLVQSRLDFAKTLNPRVHTVLIERSDSPENIAKKVVSAIGQKPVLALECTGVESSIRSAIFVSQPAIVSVSKAHACLCRHLRSEARYS